MDQTKRVTAEYEGLLVSFTKDGWINATSVAHKYKKEPNDWLRQRDTVEYLVELGSALGVSGCQPEFKEISRLLEGSAAYRVAALRITKKTGLVYTKAGSPVNGGGTWLHPKAGVALARWVNTRFSVWCDMQIDRILREHFAAEDIRIAEYLPSYHHLHDQIGALASGSSNARFVHMNTNRAINRAIGIGPGERGRLGIPRRSLLVVAQSLGCLAMAGAKDHHDGYQLLKKALQNIEALRIS